MIKPFAKTLIAMLLCLAVGLQATAQKSATVTIDITGGSLKNIIELIEKQTDYVFSYRDDVVAIPKAITLKVKNQSVNSTLNRALAGTGLTYEILSDKSIIIKRKPQPKTEAAQTVGTCSGTVLDSSGDPVVGASILVKGTSIGDATDIDGHFSLTGVKNGATLRISSIGYTPEEIAWYGQPLEITLKDDVSCPKIG